MSETVMISLRMPSGLVDRVDARGKRSEVIRDAIERLLGQELAPVPAEVSRALNGNVRQTTMVDADVLHVWLQGRSSAARRDVCEGLDWSMARVDKATVALLKAGRLLYASPGHFCAT